MERAEPNYYMVRAMRQTDAEFRYFFDNDIVAVGWSDVDFSRFTDVENLVEEVTEHYYRGGVILPQVIGKRRNEVRRFEDIMPGDRIVVPYYDSVCIATALDKQDYDHSVAKSLDLSNRRRVEYRRHKDGVLDIPRALLSEGLQRRLRMRGSTIIELNEFKEELEKLWSASDDAILSGKMGWNYAVANEEADRIRKFKGNLLANIQSGTSNLEAGGLGLEHLVEELLSIEGYDARILSKHHFPGFADADVEAIRADIITTRLLVQVKHHVGISDTWGATQLLEIFDKNPDVCKEWQLVLVTTADASIDLKNLCETKDIVLITGVEFVDWLWGLMSKLTPKTKAKLGIIDCPSLATYQD